jgi:hypothetical protein
MGEQGESSGVIVRYSADVVHRPQRKPKKHNHKHQHSHDYDSHSPKANKYDAQPKPDSGGVEKGRS